MLFQQGLLTYCPLTNVFPLFSNDLQEKINEAEFSYSRVSLEDSSIGILQCTIFFLQEPLFPNKVVHLPEFFVEPIKYPKWGEESSLQNFEEMGPGFGGRR